MSWFSEYKKSLKMLEVEEYFDLFFLQAAGVFAGEDGLPYQHYA